MFMYLFILGNFFIFQAKLSASYQELKYYIPKSIISFK
jgi:hypothetical protein